MAYNRPDDDLAYGPYHGQGPPEGEEGERGFIGDVGKRLFGGRKQDQPVSTFALDSPKLLSPRRMHLPAATCTV